MSVARVTEITSSSPKSFDEAMRAGLARANKTLENVSGAWIKNQEVVTTYTAKIEGDVMKGKAATADRDPREFEAKRAKE